MQAGKTLFVLFPGGVWGTHCFIYKAATQILQGNGVTVGRDFPSWRQLAWHEGLRGPDGASMRSRLEASTMYYNPTTGRGDCLTHAMRYFEKLREAYEQHQSTGRLARPSLSGGGRFHDPSLAKIATWLGHFVVDALTPPHHYGYYERTRVALVFWRFRSNWHDPYAQRVWSPHIRFEYRMMFSGRRRYFGSLKLKEQLARDLQADPRALGEYLKGKITWVDDLNLYRDYLKWGWSRTIQEKMNRLLLPEIASVVATVWYAAFHSSFTHAS